MGRALGADHWRGVVEEQVESGLNGAAFCRERGICRKTFYGWRRRFAVEQEAAGAADEGFAEVIHRVDDRAWSGVNILPGPPRAIRLERGFDAATLQAVLSVLDAVPSA